jgi:hypothetical protein
MACIDVCSQADYELHKDDPAACLHIMQGEYGCIGGAAVIDSVFGWARIAQVTGATCIGSVRGSAIIEVLGGTAEIGTVCDSARLGYVRDEAAVGMVTDWAGVGCVRDRARIGRITDWASIGTVEGSASIASISGTARVGAVRDRATIGHAGQHATIGAALGSARITSATGSTRIGFADGPVQITASGLAVIHAHAGNITAAEQVTIYQYGPAAQIRGGRIVPTQDPSALEVSGWAAYTGTFFSEDSLTVFKAVNAHLVSDHGTAYPIGGNVTATDWKPDRKPGNGLHFSPHPMIAASRVASGSRRYLACLVRAADAVIIDADEIKARSCRVLHEVDSMGIPLVSEGGPRE